MPHHLTQKLMLLLSFLLLMPGQVLAHKPLLLVEESGEGKILIETGFSTGESAAGFKVFLREKATGRLLEAFTIPEEGVFEIPMPAFPYTVTFDAGEGHIVTAEGPFAEEATHPPTATVPDDRRLPGSEKAVSSTGREELLVGCSIPPLCWLAEALCLDSSIQVIDIIPPGLAVGDHSSWLHEHEGEVSDILQQLDAVLTIRQIWSHDPLFRYARRWNINTIEVDASMPFDPGLNGVSLLDVPADSQAERIESCPSKQISPYIWLSLSNVLTMADILAKDLQQLLPAEAEQVAASLAAFKHAVFTMKNRYVMEFLEVDRLDIAALTDRLVYLTSDLNLPVAGYFLKDEYYWTADDIEQFRQTLIENEVNTVIHLWQPKQEIEQAIQEAGAALAVLNTFESGQGAENIPAAERYLHLMEANLETLLNAMNTAQSH